MGYFSDADTDKFAVGGVIEGPGWAENTSGEPIKVQRIGQVIRPDGSIMCEYARRN